MVAPPIVTLIGGEPPSSPQFWLDAATQVVRSYCGWHISPALEETLVIDGPGGWHLQLPSKFVDSVSVVLNDGVDVTADVEVSQDGMLHISCGRWSTKFGGIKVTLNHGFPVDEVADLSGIISKLASRAAVAAGNISRQNAGTMGVSYGTVNGLPPGTDLFQSEKEQLARYYMRTL